MEKETISRDNIKETIAFFEKWKEIFSFVENAEDAVLVLANLHSNRDTLESRIKSATAELEKASGEVVLLKGAVAKQREELAAERVKGLAAVRGECDLSLAAIVNGFIIVREQEQAKVNVLQHEAERLAGEVEELEGTRDSLRTILEETQKTREVEADKLRAINAEMAALKNRL